MSTTELIDLIKQLPEDKKRKVENLVHLLSAEIDIKTTEKKPGQNINKLPREFGSLKGFVKYMADDFDAPLEDFKDYI